MGTHQDIRILAKSLVGVRFDDSLERGAWIKSLIDDHCGMGRCKILCCFLINDFLKYIDRFVYFRDLSREQKSPRSRENWVIIQQLTTKIVIFAHKATQLECHLTLTL